MVIRFLDYLELERHYSPKTIESYRGDLECFRSYFENLDADLTWNTIHSDIIRNWIEYQMDHGLAASSIDKRLSALRSFYRFALARELVTANPAHHVSGPKKSRPLPQFVKESDINTILDKQHWGEDYESVLTRTLLIVFYESGVRVSELVGLDDKDVDFLNHQLKVTGKRNKQRVIPFGEEMAETLQRYISLRDAEVDKLTDALFLTSKGCRMSTAMVRTRVKRVLSQIPTLKKCSPHVLRHSFATAMLNHNARLESVKKLLGHESLSTTEIYTHTTFEQLKKEYKNAHPRVGK